jgi:hypothetical protein
MEIEQYVLRYLGQHIGFGGQGHDDLRRRNVAWITRVMLANGQHALRACVTHVDTNTDDIDALVAGLSESSSND